MAANTQPVFPLTPKLTTQTIANADGTTVKTVFTAGTNGSRLSRLNLLSNDTSNREIGIYINSVLVGTVQAPIGAGQSSSVPPKNVLDDANIVLGYYDANGNKVIDLPASATVGIGSTTTVTSGKTVTGVAAAADF